MLKCIENSKKKLRKLFYNEEERFIEIIRHSEPSLVIHDIKYIHYYLSDFCKIFESNIHIYTTQASSCQFLGFYKHLNQAIYVKYTYSYYRVFYFLSL